MILTIVLHLGNLHAASEPDDERRHPGAHVQGWCRTSSTARRGPAGSGSLLYPTRMRTCGNPLNVRSARRAALIGSRCSGCVSTAATSPRSTAVSQARSIAYPARTWSARVSSAVTKTSKDSAAKRASISAVSGSSVARRISPAQGTDPAGDAARGKADPVPVGLFVADRPQRQFSLVGTVSLEVLRGDVQQPGHHGDLPAGPDQAGLDTRHRARLADQPQRDRRDRGVFEGRAVTGTAGDRAEPVQVRRGGRRRGPGGDAGHDVGPRRVGQEFDARRPAERPDRDFEVGHGGTAGRGPVPAERVVLGKAQLGAFTHDEFVRSDVEQPRLEVVHRRCPRHRLHEHLGLGLRPIPGHRRSLHNG